eukprot:TRINITY_DN1886_c0_g1_i2.p1 TRINITY_DN1886_c0_g1~~TRINITY_DN1886_c0_g1_i2.p1  ORF type:complete len:112 (+),score=10.93 TRINITY_DN1886_c0_g1_i2:20-355(+)
MGEVIINPETPGINTGEQQLPLPTNPVARNNSHEPASVGATPVPAGGKGVVARKDVRAAYCCFCLLRNKRVKLTVTGVDEDHMVRFCRFCSREDPLVGMYFFLVELVFLLL